MDGEAPEPDPELQTREWARNQRIMRDRAEAHPVYCRMADIKEIDPKASNAFATSRSFPEKDRNWVWKARFGTVVTRKKLVQWGKLPAGSEKCPRCPSGQDDTIGHRLGGCGHETVGGMHTLRHDKAVRMVAALAQRGKRGGYHVEYNAGKNEEGSTSNMVKGRFLD